MKKKNEKVFLVRDYKERFITLSCSNSSSYFITHQKPRELCLLRESVVVPTSKRRTSPSRDIEERTLLFRFCQLRSRRK